VALRLKATTLGAARQSRDKLANEISKLEAQSVICRRTGELVGFMSGGPPHRQLTNFRPATAHLRPCSGHMMMRHCISSGGRWRGADEFEPDFRSIRVHQKVRVLQKRLGRRVFERAASSPERTELDYESGVSARQAYPIRLCPRTDDFFIGVSATLAWQSYGGAARQMIAGWSPHLAWLALPPAPTSPSPEQLVAMSRGLAVMRQNVDKLAADITKLQAIQQGALDRTSTSPPSTSVAPARKPVPQPPPVRGPSVR
jgi:hypothetical protein